MRKLTCQFVAVTALASVCWLTTAAAETKVGPKHSEEDLPAFSTLDTNQDGYLSISELNKQLEVMEHFSALDTDKDRKLSAEEFASIHAETVE